MPSRPVLTLFLWEDGSHFDTIINGYQNSPHFVAPLNPFIPPCDGEGRRLCADDTNTRENDVSVNNTVLSHFRNMTDTRVDES